MVLSSGNGNECWSIINNYKVVLLGTNAGVKYPSIRVFTWI